MMVACPSCTTRHHLSIDLCGAGGAALRCMACGHSWIEARARDVTPYGAAIEHAAIDDPATSEVEREAARLAACLKQAEQRRLERLAQRRRRFRSWGAFALALAVPSAALAAFPEEVARFTPPVSALYAKAGIEVNRRGLKIAEVRHEQLVVDGKRVLAIRGRVENVSRWSRKVPPLGFALYDEKREPLYFWRLDRLPKRQLVSGESVRFVTRVAAPPPAARKIEIRFVGDGAAAQPAE